MQPFRELFLRARSLPPRRRRRRPPGKARRQRSCPSPPSRLSTLTAMLDDSPRRNNSLERLLLPPLPPSPLHPRPSLHPPPPSFLPLPLPPQPRFQHSQNPSSRLYLRPLNLQLQRPRQPGRVSFPSTHQRPLPCPRNERRRYSSLFSLFSRPRNHLFFFHPALTCLRGFLFPLFRPSLL